MLNYFLGVEVIRSKKRYLSISKEICAIIEWEILLMVIRFESTLSSPIYMYSGNQAAINIANNPVFYARTINFDKGVIGTCHVHSSASYLFTKPVGDFESSSLVKIEISACMNFKLQPEGKHKGISRYIVLHGAKGVDG